MNDESNPHNEPIPKDYEEACSWVYELTAINKKLKRENKDLELKLESKYEDCTTNTLDHIWNNRGDNPAGYNMAHDLLTRYRVSRDKFPRKEEDDDFTKNI